MHKARRMPRTSAASICQDVVTQARQSGVKENKTLILRCIARKRYSRRFLRKTFERYYIRLFNIHVCQQQQQQQQQHLYF